MESGDSKLAVIVLLERGGAIKEKQIPSQVHFCIPAFFFYFCKKQSKNVNKDTMFGKKKDNKEHDIATSEPLKLTTIAAGTVLKGIIDVEGSLRVDGTIEGDITCRKTVVLGPQGKITGNVTSVSAILQGTLKGDIHVTDELMLKSGCMVNGDIYTSKLEVEPKACFNGTCNTIKEDQQMQTEAMEKAPKSDQAMKK